MSKLNDYYNQIKNCNHCQLQATRTNLVFGDGDENADLMFVGEAPGKNEDIQGKPFVGAAGKLLNKLLGEIGLKREDVYIANIIKSRPPDNRDPLPEEIEACKPYLIEQIKIIGPKVIATLGAHATRTMLKKNVIISKVHGQVFKIGKFKVIPIFHPAAALYRGSVLEDLKNDFSQLKKLIETKEYDQSSDAKQEEKAKPVKQEKLF